MTYEDLTVLLPPTGSQYSLGSLTRTCDELGVAWRALHWEKNPPPIEFGSAPAVIPIVLDDGRSHFIALLACRKDAFLIQDFPASPAWISASDLRSRWRWDGTALHVSRDRERLNELAVGFKGLQTIRWILPGLLFLISFILWQPRSGSKNESKSHHLPHPKKARPNSGFTVVELLVSLAVVGLLLSLIVPAVQSARERSRQVQCLNNLKQLGTACQNFESARRVIPSYLGRSPVSNPGPVGSNISVQAQLLPYLDQHPLYDRIDKRENGSGMATDPPGSEHNSELLTTAVPVFACPSDSVDSGEVSYRGCTGTTPGVHATIPETDVGAAKIGAFIRFDGLRFSMMKDGLSQTVLFSERLVGDHDDSVLTPSGDIADMSQVPPQGWSYLYPNDAVTRCRFVTSADAPHWSHAGSTWLLSGYTQTLYNHVLAPNSAIPDCGSGDGVGFHGAVSARSYHTGGVNVVFADGAARFVSEDVDLGVWRALASIRGEEVVGDF